MTTTGQCRHWLVVFAAASSLVSNSGARRARVQRGWLSVAVPRADAWNQSQGAAFLNVSTDP